MLPWEDLQDPEPDSNSLRTYNQTLNLMTDSTWWEDLQACAMLPWEGLVTQKMSSFKVQGLGFRVLLVAWI